MRRTASPTFVKNDDEFLWFCLTVETSGIAGSKRLRIADEVMALDFDNAVSLRLLKHRRLVAENAAKLIAYEVSKLFGSSDTENEDAILDDVEVW